jgi:hypothetical protein
VDRADGFAASVSVASRCVCHEGSSLDRGGSHIFRSTLCSVASRKDRAKLNQLPARASDETTQNVSASGSSGTGQFVWTALGIRRYGTMQEAADAVHGERMSLGRICPTDQAR